MSKASSEAQIFRMLLRTHAASELGKRGHHIEAGLIRYQLPPLSVDKYQTVEYSEVEQVFSRLVTEFDALYGGDIASRLHDWPTSMSAVEAFTIGVMQHILAGGRLEWGRVIAVSSFLTHVAICCSEHGMADQIGPLIDHAVQFTNESLMEFVRLHGGWTAFAQAFRSRRRETTTASSLGALGIGTTIAICAIL